MGGALECIVFYIHRVIKKRLEETSLRMPTSGFESGNFTNAPERYTILADVSLASKSFCSFIVRVWGAPIAHRVQRVPLRLSPGRCDSGYTSACGPLLYVLPSLTKIIHIKGVD